MIYVLLEQESNVINSVEQEFIKRYHKTSIKRFGREDLQKKELEMYAKPPLFNNEWLIVCSSVQRWLVNCYPDRNTILICVRRKGELQTVLSAISSMEYRFIDNYKVDKEVVLTWVEKELSVGSRLAARLYNRVSGNLREVVNAVTCLRAMPVITKSVIDSYVTETSGIQIWRLVQYLLGISNDLEFAEIAQMLSDYRYAVKWLRDSLVRELGIYLEVYRLMDCGEMGLQDYHVTKQDGSKELQTCSDYRLRKIIESHLVVSTDVVYFLYLYLQRVGVGVNGTSELLEIFKIGGNNVYNYELS